jgi:hypothetical protein
MIISAMEAVAAAQRAHRTERTLPRWLVTSAGVVGAFLLAFAALFAGVGILYLIRDGGLGFGAKIHNALPLEQLAGQDSQPFSHMAIAWIPAGFVAGLAFFSLTRFGVLARTAVLTALAAVSLLLAGAVSDSIAVNDPLSPHLASQLTRGATWIAVALFALGSLCAGLLPPRRRDAANRR